MDIEEEYRDIVFSYISYIYRKTGKPVSLPILRKYMEIDSPGSFEYFNTSEQAKSLEAFGLVGRRGMGYVPIGKSGALRVQLSQPSVAPFSREYGETSEAHIDKVWDFSQSLTKPTAGGKWGLGATGHLLSGDTVWEGLEQDTSKGVK